MMAEAPENNVFILLKYLKDEHCWWQQLIKRPSKLDENGDKDYISSLSVQTKWKRTNMDLAQDYYYYYVNM